MSADLHTLTGAYAAHALAEQEELAFERHLDVCQACAQEVRELQAAAARLGAAVATPPPAELWDRVQAEVRVTRQLPPRIGRADRRQRRFSPLLAVAAALLVVVVSLAVLNLDLGRRLDRSPRTVDQVAAVLDAPDARTVAARPGSPGQSRVVVSRARGQAVFVASGLPAVPKARTYQLWLIGASGPRSAGVVDPGAGGRVTRLLDGRVSQARQVALTVERQGGAPAPTSDPVVIIDLGWT
jgi:anti-sigma-K factor RskA